MKVDLFLALVRSGLYERPLAAEELASVRAATDADWAAILKVARQQTVLGQLYQALFQLPNDVRPPEAIVTALMSDALRAVRHAYAAATASQDLVERLRAAGLSPVVMKGVSVAAFYRHPEFRTAGDIDIYLPASEIKQAAALLDESAVSPDGSRTGRFEGVAVDLHDRYFDLHCGTRKLPAVGTPEATLLMLSAHILKHAIGPGVGLRQLRPRMPATNLKTVSETLTALPASVTLSISFSRSFVSMLQRYVISVSLDQHRDAGRKRSSSAPRS